MADSTVAYPTVWNAAPFAEPLKNAAKLIQADLGTDVIAIDAGNWDLHTGYGTIQWGTMQSNISGLAQALAAFMDDLGDAPLPVTVVTISEFGRRVAENGSQGFDHGWGNMMLVAGAGVKGGQYYGSWPGLDTGSQSRRRPQGHHRLPQRARRDRQPALPGPLGPPALPRAVVLAGGTDGLTAVRRLPAPGLACRMTRLLTAVLVALAAMLAAPATASVGADRDGPAPRGGRRPLP